MWQIRLNPQKRLAAAFSKALDKIAWKFWCPANTFFPAKDNLEIEPNHYRKLRAISNSFVKIRTLTSFTRENTLFLYLYFYIFNIMKWTIGLPGPNHQGVEEIKSGDQVPETSRYTDDLHLIAGPQENQMQWRRWRN